MVFLVNLLHKNRENIFDLFVSLLVTSSSFLLETWINWWKLRTSVPSSLQIIKQSSIGSLPPTSFKCSEEKPISLQLWRAHWGTFHLYIIYENSKIPTLGYVIKDLGMCLLDRNWEKDQQHFKDFIEVFENHPRPLCVFLCPEGTTITYRMNVLWFSPLDTHVKSQAFAKKTDRPVFDVFSSLKLHLNLI